MSATIQKDQNFFIKGDKVVFKEKDHWLNGEHGEVIRTISESVELKMTSGIRIITYYKKLKKLKKKTK